MRPVSTCADAATDRATPAMSARCTAPRLPLAAPCAPSRGGCRAAFDTRHVSVRETWRYDGAAVVVADELREPPALPSTHDWDNRSLGMRSDVRGARLAQCRRCGARVALIDGVLLASRRLRGPLSGEPLAACLNETRGDVAFPSSLHYQGLDVTGDVRVALADAWREAFVRAGGDVVCHCGHRYYDHPTDPADEFLHTICDGSRVKL